MDPLLPAIALSLTGSVLLVLTYLHLYREDGRRYLAIWAVSWAVVSVRNALGLLVAADVQSPTLLAANQLAALASGLLLLWGSLEFARRRMSRAWLLPAAFGAAWVVGATAAAVPFFALTAPTFAFLAVVYGWTGVAILRAPDAGGLGRHLAGWSLIAWGIHKLDFPLLRPLENFAPWGYAAAAAFSLLIALGTLLIHFSRIRGELLESRQRYRLLAENVRSDLIWTLALVPATEANGEPRYRTRLLYITPSVKQMLGYEPEEMYGDERVTLKDILTPESFEMVRTDILRPLASVPLGGAPPAVERLELAHVHRDGHIVRAEVSINLMRGEGGAPQILGVTRDVTQRWEAEQRTRRAHAELQQIFHSVPDAMRVIDRDLRSVRVNTAFLEMTGRREEEIVYRSCCETFGKPFCETSGCAAKRVLAGEERVEFDFVKQRRRQGDEGVFTVVATPFRDIEGRVVGVLEQIRDVTERRRAEAERARLEQQLLQSQKMEAMGRLAGGVAHDFNNLLTTIGGACEFLQEDLQDQPAVQEDLQDIQQATGRATALTRQLLAFSRRQVLQPELVDLAQTVRDLEKMTRRLIGEHIELTADVDGGSAAVVADPGQVEQIVLNLVVNARDAMPEGGRLTVSVRQVAFAAGDPERPQELDAGTFAVLSVVDTGEGMDPATRARVFEPFFTTKALGRGTGLGLSTVYGIVRQSGGAITVASTPGEGTRFDVYLPLAPENDDAGAGTANGDARREPEATDAAHRGTETVLVAEDEEAVGVFVRRALERCGYRVILTRTPGEALLACELHEGPIELLLTDVVMPRLSGPELVQRIREKRPAVKVLLMSGYSESHHGIQLAADGALPFLAKPFTSAALVAKVRAVLDAAPAQAPASDSAPGSGDDEGGVGSNRTVRKNQSAP